MNEKSQPPPGKITVHGNGVGAPTAEMVEKRAREIAKIDERNPNDFTDADWDKAQRELLGKAVIPAAEDQDERTDMMIDRDETPDESGHRVSRPGLDEDDETVGALLVEDGNEEAVHDQMLEAAKEDQEAEG